MQQVIVVEFEESTDNEKVIAELRADREIKKLEIFNTPFEALAAQIGQEKIEQLIRDGVLEQLDDEKLLREMAEGTAHDIAYDIKEDLSDAGTYRNLAIDNVLCTLQKHIGELGDRDKKIAASVITDNLMGYSDDYSTALDGDILEQIATGAAKEIFEARIKDLSGHDKEIAEKFLKDQDSNTAFLY